MGTDTSAAQAGAAVDAAIAKGASYAEIQRLIRERNEKVNNNNSVAGEVREQHYEGQVYDISSARNVYVGPDGKIDLAELKAGEIVRLKFEEVTGWEPGTGQERQALTFDNVPEIAPNEKPPQLLASIVEMRDSGHVLLDEHMPEGIDVVNTASKGELADRDLTMYFDDATGQSVLVDNRDGSVISESEAFAIINDSGETMERCGAQAFAAETGIQNVVEGPFESTEAHMQMIADQEAGLDTAAQSFEEFSASDAFDSFKNSDFVKGTLNVVSKVPFFGDTLCSMAEGWMGTNHLGQDNAEETVVVEATETAAPAQGQVQQAAPEPSKDPQALAEVMDGEKLAANREEIHACEKDHTVGGLNPTSLAGAQGHGKDESMVVG